MKGFSLPERCRSPVVNATLPESHGRSRPGLKRADRSLQKDHECELAFAVHARRRVSLIDLYSNTSVNSHSRFTPSVEPLIDLDRNAGVNSRSRFTPSDKPLIDLNLQELLR